MVIIYEENTSQSLSHHLPVSNEIHYLLFLLITRAFIQAFIQLKFTIINIILCRPQLTVLLLYLLLSIQSIHYTALALSD